VVNLIDRPESLLRPALAVRVLRDSGRAAFGVRRARASSAAAA
jgi:hypothetical protein